MNLINFYDQLGGTTMADHRGDVHGLLQSLLEMVKNHPPVQRDASCHSDEDDDNKDPKYSILKLRNEIHILNSIKEDIIDKMILQRQEIIKGLLDSTSPLLSLGVSLLKYLVGFLDEESLFQCSLASETLKERVITQQHWIDLFDKRTTRTVREEKYKDEDKWKIRQSWDFGHCASTARSFEDLACIHYDYTQDLNESDEKIVRCPGCEEFERHFFWSAERLLESIRTGEEDVFVRLSQSSDSRQDDRRSSSSKLIWQGYCIHKFCERTACLNLLLDNALPSMQWPGLKEFNQILSSQDGECISRCQPILKLHLQQLSQGIQVTVIFRKQILVATGGSLRTACVETGGWIYLHPQNDDLHATSLNKRDLMRPCLWLSKDECTLSIIFGSLFGSHSDINASEQHSAT